MSRVAQYPLSPQHTGGSIPSTFSGQTNSTRLSSMTSYSNPASIRSAGDALRSKYSTAVTSPEMRGSQRQMTVQSPGSSRGHTRASSNASMTSFPAYDASSGYDGHISPPPPARYQDYSTTRSASISSASKVKIKPFLRKIASQDKGSIDLSRSVAENEGLGIYTNSSSAAGNVRRDGAYGGGNRNNNNNSSSSTNRNYHARNGSTVSQSSAVTSSSRKGALYVHPMRQTPQSYTPPVMQSSHTSRANSEDGGETYSSFDRTPPPGIAPSSYVVSSLPTPYAPLPATSTRRTPPPPLFVRTHSSSRLRSSSSQTTIPPLSGTPSSYRTPVDPILHGSGSGSGAPLHHISSFDASISSPEPMFPLPSSTARSSLDSAFRTHLPGGKRSRGNTTAAAADDIDPIARVAALRADFAAKEAAKDSKYAAARSRAMEKEQRRQERRDESARRRIEAAGGGRHRSRSRARSNATARSGSIANGGGAGRGRTASEKSVPLATVEYSSTHPAPYPVDEELEWIRRGKRPPTKKKARGGGLKHGAGGGDGDGRDLEKGGSASGSKGIKAGGTAVRGGWSSFWFSFKTVWLKFKRSMGAKSDG